MFQKFWGAMASTWPSPSFAPASSTWICWQLRVAFWSKTNPWNALRKFSVGVERSSSIRKKFISQLKKGGYNVPSFRACTDTSINSESMDSIATHPNNQLRISTKWLTTRFLSICLLRSKIHSIRMSIFAFYIYTPLPPLSSLHHDANFGGSLSGHQNLRKSSNSELGESHHVPSKIYPNRNVIPCHRQNIRLEKSSHHLDQVSVTHLSPLYWLRPWDLSFILSLWFSSNFLCWNGESVSFSDLLACSLLDWLIDVDLFSS